MTNKELHDKFHQMLGQQVEDVMASFGKAMEKMDDIEKTIDTKLDAKFDELLKRLPPPTSRRDTVGRAQRIPIEPGQNSGAAATAVGASVVPTITAEVEDYYEDEVDQNQNYVQPPAPPPAGRPQVYIRNGRPAPPPQVRDHDHIPKLKLNIPPFEGRYVPDIYLTCDEDMTTLDTTKNIAYMYICEVISNANYATIYLCYPEQKYFTDFCAMSNCRCMDICTIHI